MHFFITGGNRGIGLELARQLHERGDLVTATVRDRAGAGAMLDAGVRAIELDVTSQPAIDSLAMRLGGEAIDVLINNAGVGSTSKTLAECSAEEFARVFAVNAYAPLLVARGLLPNLAKGRRKVVMNISSQLASIKNNTGGSSYGYRASKAALNMLTTCMANELALQGFTCFTAHPGWVKTDMGGPNAPMTVAQSASALIKLLDESTPAHNGGFFNYDGTTLPW